MEQIAALMQEKLDAADFLRAGTRAVLPAVATLGE
jgi:hypothetical protein